jgi:hypothetical protein
MLGKPGAVLIPLAAPETLYIVDGWARVERSSAESVDLNGGDLVVLSPGDRRTTLESVFKAVFVAGPAPGADAPPAADQGLRA